MEFAVSFLIFVLAHITGVLSSFLLSLQGLEQSLAHSRCPVNPCLKEGGREEKGERTGREGEKGRVERPLKAWPASLSH